MLALCPWEPDWAAHSVLAPLHGEPKQGEVLSRTPPPARLQLLRACVPAEAAVQLQAGRLRLSSCPRIYKGQCHLPGQ